MNKNININDIPTAIDSMMAQTMARISQAASKPDCNVSELESLTKLASELKQMKEQVAAIAHRLMAIRLAGANGEVTDLRLRRDGFLRKVQIEVSQGMINQNLLTLTDPIKRGQIKVGEELSIEAQPSGDKFDTVVVQPGNKVHERGAIGKFYRDAGISAGDVIQLSETAPGVWRLQKDQTPDLSEYAKL